MARPKVVSGKGLRVRAGRRMDKERRAAIRREMVEETGTFYLSIIGWSMPM